MQSILIAENIVMRRARMREIAAIRAMQERSLAVLGEGFYARQEIEAFIALVGTVDEAVVAEGHYFVAEREDQRIVGSAGWSLQLPGYERRPGAAAPRDASPPDRATVRSVFVDPAMARSGIATALMAHLERDAARHGIRKLQLMATLSGLPFYRRLGWRELGGKSVPLAGGLRFECVAMSKPVPPGFDEPANDRGETPRKTA